MVQMVAFHAMRGGTGKTSLAANLAVTYAQQGQRAALLDLDLPSPGLYTLFGLRASKLNNDIHRVLDGKCSLEDAFCDITARLTIPMSGSVFLLPGLPSSASENQPDAIQKAGKMFQDLQKWAREHAIDVLLLDLHPGLDEVTLFWLAAADLLLITMRLDQQDYEDTALLVEVGRKLALPRMGIVVNHLPAQISPGVVKAQMEKTYGVDVLAELVDTEDFLAGAGPVVSTGADSQRSRQYLQIVDLMRAG